jgi:hypothetical protein
VTLPANDPRIAQAAALFAQAIAILLAPPVDGLDALVPLDDAARIAGLRSKRTLVEAIRDGELQAFGRQRDRAVRRADLDRWIESRRIVHTAPTGDHESRIERRMNRLEREGAERRAA